MIVELKATSPLCDPHDTQERAIVEAVVKVVRATRMTRQVLVNSFSPALLLLMKEVAPEIPRDLGVFGLQLLTADEVAAALNLPVKLIDKKDFPTFGDGVWWAIVTLGTVGYGDIVPHTGWGRVLGSAVIVFGVTFISLLFATVTSYLVASDQEEAATSPPERSFDEKALHALLREIASRLTAIEADLAALKDRN